MLPSQTKDIDRVSLACLKTRSQHGDALWSQEPPQTHPSGLASAVPSSVAPGHPASGSYDGFYCPKKEG